MQNRKRQRNQGQVNTSFACANCAFEQNMQWSRHAVAKGGAVYVDGKTALDWAKGRNDTSCVSELERGMER